MSEKKSYKRGYYKKESDKDGNITITIIDKDGETATYHQNKDGKITGKDSFVFLESFLESILTIPNEDEQFRCLMALCKYGLYGDESGIEEKGYTAMMIKNNKKLIIANDKKWLKTTLAKRNPFDSDSKNTSDELLTDMPDTSEQKPKDHTREELMEQLNKMRNSS